MSKRRRTSQAFEVLVQGKLDHDVENAEKTRQQSLVEAAEPLAHIDLSERVKDVVISLMGRLLGRLELREPRVRTIVRVLTTQKGLVQVVLTTPAVMALHMWIRKSCLPPVTV